MKPICIIAARGGSKGVPNKNIRLLGKKPLIAHTIESAIKSKLFSNVIVSTENKKIAYIAKKYGATVPFYRPKKLAADNASMDDVLLDVIKKLKLLEYEKGYKKGISRLSCQISLTKELDGITLHLLDDQLL